MTVTADNINSDYVQRVYNILMGFITTLSVLSHLLRRRLQEHDGSKGIPLQQADL